MKRRKRRSWKTMRVKRRGFGLKRVREGGLKEVGRTE